MNSIGLAYRYRFAPSVVLLAAFVGCHNLFVTPVSDDEPLVEIEPEEVSTKLVGDMARAWGLQPAKVTGVALVTNLNDTGSDPDPSEFRSILIDDMKRHGVDSPNQLLAHPNTTMAIIQAILPPAVQKGDRIDVKVQVPTRSKTASLEDGWVMFARLQEMASLGNQIRSGHTLAVAEGAILIDALVTGGDSQVDFTRGQILGGGVANKSRTIGLAIRDENHSVVVSKLIGKAINQRFHSYDRGVKKGAATPKRDNFIELAIQPQYRNNLMRYVRAVELVPLNESTEKQLRRMETLRSRLMDQATSARAALKLEAIGHEAASLLLEGVQSPDALVRFYSAEALAYLNHEGAVSELATSASDSSLRWRALTALSAMTNSQARDALSDLLHSESAETKYGAFQALQDANPRDPLIQGENLNDTLALHQIATHGEPMVHIRKSKHPEIVVFGSDLALATPLAISAGGKILVKASGEKVKVSRFDVEGQQTVFSSNELTDVIRAIVSVGGTYADVVSAIHDAKRQNALSVRVKIDALPRTGRKFQREEKVKPAEALET